MYAIHRDLVLATEILSLSGYLGFYKGRILTCDSCFPLHGQA
jgi:hypothetical protein